jgi:hypothetical protein
VGALSDSGTLIWHYTIPNYASAFRGAAVAEINGDAYPDVVFGTAEGHVVALKGNNGALIWNIDLAAQYGDTIEVDHAPLIADFDNNDTIDVFIQGGQTKYPNWHNNYGRAYMFTAGIGLGPPWLMFQNDLRRQSSLCANPFSEVPETKQGAGNGFNLYPNPAQDAVSIACSSWDQGWNGCSIVIYDMYGNAVRRAAFGQGNQTVNTAGMPAGIYVLRLFSDTRVLFTSRFVKM